MEETRRNSMKLDIEAVRLSDNDRDQPTETYKKSSEFDSNEKSPGATKNSTTMVRDKSDKVDDGADESMLAGEEKTQLARKDEVKFIPAGQTVNGDAKIDIGAIDKGFTGMTKEELMKYANDPFWVRLRWIFFILFWALWIAMLAGAILIILKAPKCSKPVPLSWFKEGPLVQLPAINSNKNLIQDLKSINAKGVIYQLPADKTYAVETKEVQDYVKDLVAQFKNTSIHVILDLTPNYVTTENELYKSALINETYRSAFVWAERARKPNNWVPKVVDKDANKDGGKENSAWKQVKTDNFVLSQFGVNNIDLQLNDPIAKEKFKDVLRSLIKLGVRGFRLANAKHYIIDPSLPEEIPDTNAAKQAVTNEYDFYTHKATTNQPGIGDLLHEFWKVVNNDTNGEGFLSVSEKIEDLTPFQPFHTRHGIIGFDLPIVSVLPYALTKNTTDNLAVNLSKELTKVVKTYGNRTWVQWMCEKQTLSKSNIGISEYNIFLFLLPGVPVGTLEEFTGENATNVEEITKLEKIRETQSYQHGSFDVYTDLNDTVIAYSRIKSGNPGYFVALNPSELFVRANFSFVANLPDQLTVDLVSQLYSVPDVTKNVKVPTEAIPISPRSAVVLTYAPKN